MRRCEWIVRPPSKRMNRCLPCASTDVTARPARRSSQRAAAEARVRRADRVRHVAGEHRPDAVGRVVDRVALGHLGLRVRPRSPRQSGRRGTDASPGLTAGQSARRALLAMVALALAIGIALQGRRPAAAQPAASRFSSSRRTRGNVPSWRRPTRSAAVWRSGLSGTPSFAAVWPGEAELAVVGVARRRSVLAGPADAAARSRRRSTTRRSKRRRAASAATSCGRGRPRRATAPSGGLARGRGCGPAGRARSRRGGRAARCRSAPRRRWRRARRRSAARGREPRRERDERADAGRVVLRAGRGGTVSMCAIRMLRQRARAGQGADDVARAALAGDRERGAADGQAGLRRTLAPRAGARVSRPRWRRGGRRRARVAGEVVAGVAGGAEQRERGCRGREHGGQRTSTAALKGWVRTAAASQFRVSVGIRR